MIHGMGAKAAFKRLLERVLDARIVRNRSGFHILEELPRGVNAFHDISAALPRFRPALVFDVGANIGQSAKLYHQHFSGVTVHSFEPVLSTFTQLRQNLRDQPHQYCHRIALGAAPGTGRMLLREGSELSRLLLSSEKPAGQTEEVPTTTIDLFCQQHAITRVDYLKIDTEGHDLEVLKGAAAMLAQSGVGLVEVEAGMNPANRTHVPLEHLKSFLESHGYFLFGLYEQVAEFPTRQPNLRRTNLVFISAPLIAANRAH
jgi:FkbM family methyltransferase